MKRYILVTFLFLLIPFVTSCTLISNQSDFVLRKDISAVAPLTFRAERASAANEALLNFPNTIPGAAYIDKYITPGAKYCLVHIKQQHLIPDILEEEKKEVELVQEDIFDILEYLVLNNDLKGVYSEALATSENISNLYDKFIALDAKERELQKIIDSKEQIVQEALSVAEGVSGEDLNRLQKDLENKKRKFRSWVKRKREFEEENDEFWKYNASLRIGMEYYGVKMFAAETEYSNEQADLVGLNRYSRIYIEKVLDDREDVLLNLISQRSTHLGVVVYGAGHSWGGYESFGSFFPIGERLTRDNIALWNKQNPEKKFSLIEVTPARL